MTYEFKPAFDRSIRSLPADRKARIKRAVAGLTRFFDGAPRPAGLGLKRLRDDVWEVRAGLADRVLFRLAGGHVEFLLAGTHDEIRRLLRRT